MMRQILHAAFYPVWSEDLPMSDQHMILSLEIDKSGADLRRSFRYLCTEPLLNRLISKIKRNTNFLSFNHTAGISSSSHSKSTHGLFHPALPVPSTLK